MKEFQLDLSCSCSNSDTCTCSCHPHDAEPENDSASPCPPPEAEDNRIDDSMSTMNGITALMPGNCQCQCPFHHGPPHGRDYTILYSSSFSETCCCNCCPESGSSSSGTTEERRRRHKKKKKEVAQRQDGISIPPLPLSDGDLPPQERGSAPADPLPNGEPSHPSRRWLWGDEEREWGRRDSSAEVLSGPLTQLLEVLQHVLTRQQEVQGDGADTQALLGRLEAQLSSFSSSMEEAKTAFLKAIEEEKKRTQQEKRETASASSFSSRWRGIARSTSPVLRALPAWTRGTSPPDHFWREDQQNIHRQRSAHALLLSRLESEEGNGRRNLEQLERGNVEILLQQQQLLQTARALAARQLCETSSSSYSSTGEEEQTAVAAATSLQEQADAELLKQESRLQWKLECCVEEEQRVRSVWIEQEEYDDRLQLLSLLHGHQQQLERLLRAHTSQVEELEVKRRAVEERAAELEKKLRHVLALPSAIYLSASPSALEESSSVDLDLPIHRRFARAHQEALKATRAQRRQV